MAATRASTLREDLSRNASGPGASAEAPRGDRCSTRTLGLDRDRPDRPARRRPERPLDTQTGAASAPLAADEEQHPREIDLIDIAAFARDCTADAYDEHLEKLLAGRPSATDVACVGQRDTARMVADVLDGAPLTGLDSLETLRLQRNAASALTAVSGEALAAVCDRLTDDSDDRRRVAAMALSVPPDPAASECLRETLLQGPPIAKVAAARGMRQRIARGLVPVEEGWRLVLRLLEDVDPQTRVAGLSLAPLFAASISAPAVQALVTSSDPRVAEAARRTAAQIRTLRGADFLLNAEP